MFAKVFASLWQGSMVGKADAQLVFVFLLAHSDIDGCVDLSPEYVAPLVGLPVERVAEALQFLEAADPRSRSKAEDGRRLVRLDDGRDWGWRIVNFEHYRSMRDEEQRRAAQRERMRRVRADAARGATTTQAPAVGPDGNGTGSQSGGESEAPQRTLAGVVGVDGEPANRAQAEREAWLREFDEYFWPNYPRKESRKAARAAWAKLKPSQGLLDRIMRAMRKLPRSGAEKQFVPYAVTWLNRERYNDDADT